MGHSVCGDYTWCSASHMQDLITGFERNHSLRSGKIPSPSTILSIVVPVSPLASVWTTMTPL